MAIEPIAERVAERLRLTLAQHRALPVGAHDWAAIAAFLVAGLAEDGIEVVEAMADLVPLHHRYPGKARLTLVPDPPAGK